MTGSLPAESSKTAMERAKGPEAANMSEATIETLQRLVRPVIVSNKKSLLSNWGGSFVCQPGRIFTPSTVEECCAIIELARRIGGIEVRAVGRCHSPGDIVFTKDWIIKMEKLQGLLFIDQTKPSITVLAGTFVSDMHTLLESASPPLAMFNVGSISEQTIDGLISTATHGTGINEPVISTAVESMRVICPLSDQRGGTQVLKCSRKKNSDLFNASLCGLGATGLIVEVTIAVDYLFKLKQVSEKCPFDFIFGRRTGAPSLQVTDVNESELLSSSSTSTSETSTSRRHHSIGNLLAHGHRLVPADEHHMPTTRNLDSSVIYPVPLDQAIRHDDGEDDDVTKSAQSRLERIARSSQFVRMAWFPTVGKVIVNRADRTLEPFQTPGILSQWHHRLIGYHLSEVLLYVSRYSTSLPPRINRAIYYLTAPSPPKKNKKAKGEVMADEPSPVIELRNITEEELVPSSENDGHVTNMESFSSGGALKPLELFAKTSSSGPEPLDPSHAITTLVDTSHRVFNVDCLFAQNTDEWAIPLCHAASAIRAMRDCIEEERLSNGERVHFPVEVRFTDGEGIWMSHCQGRKTCFIGLTKDRPFNQPTRYRQLFAKFEILMRHYAGRPHWAKAHSCGSIELQRLYPHLPDYLNLIHKMDPQGIFRNPYIRRHLLGDLTDTASPRIFKSHL